MNAADFQLRGRVLRLLAEFHRSPHNDGTLGMSPRTIANTIGSDPESIARVCDGDPAVSKALAGDAAEPGYRLNHDWLHKQAIEQQNREVADIALVDRRIQ